MNKTALVTGASGFLGRQVVQAFTSAGWDTVGTGFTRANPPAIRKVDLTDSKNISTLLQEIKYVSFFTIFLSTKSRVKKIC